MIELLQEEKEILIKYKKLLQQGKIAEFLSCLDEEYEKDNILKEDVTSITQFLVDILGNKIFKYFGSTIGVNRSGDQMPFNEIDLSSACHNGILELPQTVKKINDFVFYNSSGYHTVIVYTSDIGDGAFEDNKNLKTVIIAQSADKNRDLTTTLMPSAFIGCSNITDVYVPCSKMDWVNGMFKNYRTEIELEEADDMFISNYFQSAGSLIKVHWDYR